MNALTSVFDFFSDFYELKMVYDNHKGKRTHILQLACHHSWPAVASEMFDGRWGNCHKEIFFLVFFRNNCNKWEFNID